jgi:hypothetical protein
MHCWRQLDYSYPNEWWHFFFIVDGKVIDALARSPEYLLEICDVALRLLAASAVH